MKEAGNGRMIASQNTKDDEYVTLISREKEIIGERKFAGYRRCQIMRVELDTQTGVTTIDVRVSEESEILKKA
jgi:hypothetical protein